MNTPAELLSSITKQPVRERFGSTISQALALTFGNKASDADYTSAGYICTLFLSSILTGFPTMQLHTFVRNSRDNSPQFTFDCKSYDKILSNIEESRLLLINSEFEYIEKEIEKQDIAEALDFFTNQ